MHSLRVITEMVLIQFIIGFHNNLDIPVGEQGLTRWSPIQSCYELHSHTLASLIIRVSGVELVERAALAYNMLI